MLARRPHLGELDRHPMISRLVAGLLLVFVIYGTTIEAAHRHGRLFGTEQSQSTAVSNDDATQGSTGSARSCTECLICQLHHQFSASLASVRFKDAPPPTVAEVFQPASQRVLTRTVSARAGRGPPLVS